jgi:phosphodiesterase/alkaline phosphatase D-like protein
MNRLLLQLAIIAGAGCLLSSNPIIAQILPPQKRAEHVAITKEPELELALDNMAIVRWTTTNPRGDDEHYGVVHYGTDPEDLSQTAKGHIRLNRAHRETMFRVRMVGLKPQTIYYYKVSSMESSGESDGVESPVNHFTTPAPGERITASPEPK